MTQPPPIPPTPAPTLSPEHLAELTRAKARGLKLQRAVRVATADAWITAILAVGAILTSCGGIDQLLIGIVLGYVAFTSFRGVKGLKRFDRAAPMRLALNQVFLASAIILYAAYQLWTVATGRNQISATMKEQFSAAGVSAEDIIQLVNWIMRLTYCLLIAGTIIGQGLAAMYYKSRLKILDAYLTETPKWVTDFQKTQVG